MEYAATIAMLAVAQCVFFSFRVGAARQKYNVTAPAVSGNADFERVFRVHQNTMENLVVFLPALFAFAYYVSDVWSVVPGLVFIIGRFLYSSGYTQAAEKRGPGAMISFVANVVLVLGGLIGAVLAIVN